MQTGQNAINVNSEDNASVQAGAINDSNKDMQGKAESEKKTMLNFELTENGKSFLKKCAVSFQIFLMRLM